MTVLVTGATGLIGAPLVRMLQKPRVTSRNRDHAAKLFGELAEAISWNTEGPLPQEALNGVEAVVHLAGETVQGRWTESKKARIRDSRVRSTRALVESLRGMSDKPRVLVCASAVGIYGDRGDEVLSESTASGDGFLAEVCKEWEREAERASELGVRVVCARTGLVLSPSGGALKAMLPAFRLGVGGTLSSGNQWMPWIHIQDTVRLFLHALKNDSVAGPMNVVAPQPVTNREFTRALSRAIHRPAIFRVPAVALRLGLGEFGAAALASQRVVPEVAQRTGFEFRFTQLEHALADIFSTAESKPSAEAQSTV